MACNMADVPASSKHRLISVSSHDDKEVEEGLANSLGKLVYNSPAS
jgi:hypothetical protein